MGDFVGTQNKNHAHSCSIMSNRSMENRVRCLVDTRGKRYATFEFLEPFDWGFFVGGRLMIDSSASRFASIRMWL